MHKTSRSRMLHVLLLLAAVTAVSYPAPPEGKGRGKDKDGSSDPPLTPTIRYSITLLGTLGGSFSWGAGMNNAGHVAGTSGTTSTEPFHEVHAFVYTPSTGIRDLDALCHQDPSDRANDPIPGWILVSASDINNAGLIIGQGYVDDNLDGQLDRWVAFLYTPDNATSPPVVQ